MGPSSRPAVPSISVTPVSTAPSWSAPRSQSRSTASSDGTAKAGVPRKTVRFTEPYASASGAQPLFRAGVGRLVDLDRVQIVTRPKPIDVQDPAQVIGLVEHALRAELLALDDELLPVDVAGHHAREQWAFEHPIHPAHGEAALARLVHVVTHPFD